MNWKHDDLADDLAEHLAVTNRMIWTDMQLGSHGSPRPDVYTMQKSYEKPDPRAYEIKISVSDFRSDITSGKWQKYLKYAGAVTFAVPRGLVTKQDIPNGCGLMVRGENGWKTLKAPRIERVTLPERAYMKLLIDGIEREIRFHRDKQVSTWKINRKIKEKHGERVFQVLENLDRAEYAIEQAEKKAENIIGTAKHIAEDIKKRAAENEEKFDSVLMDFARMAGIEFSDRSSLWGVANALHQQCNVDERLLKAQFKAERAIQNMQDALTSLKPISERK